MHTPEVSLLSALRARSGRRCDSSTCAGMSVGMPLAAWKEGYFEQLAGWVHGDQSSELRACERLTAIRTVVGGDHLSALHIYDLIELVDTKGMREAASVDCKFNKNKVLYRWLYILVGGRHPGHFSCGYDKALVQRLTRVCNSLGRRPLVLQFRGNENQEARLHHLQAWGAAWAQEAYPPGTLDTAAQAAAPFERASSAYRAAMLEGSPRPRLGLQEEPLAVAVAAAATVNLLTPLLAAVAELEGPQESTGVGPQESTGVGATPRSSAGSQQQERLQRQLEEQKVTSTQLLAAKVAAEHALVEVHVGAEAAAKALRQQARAAESKLAGVQAEAAASIAQAQRETSAQLAAARQKHQKTKEQLEEKEALLREREQVHTSSFALHRANAVMERELQRAREELQQERQRLRECRDRAASLEEESAQAARELRTAQELLDSRGSDITNLRSELTTEQAARESERTAAAACAEAQALSVASLEEKRVSLAQRLRKAWDTLARKCGELEVVESDLLEERAARESERATAASCAEVQLLALEAAQAKITELQQELHGFRINAGRDAKKREHDAAAAEREEQERETARQLSRKLQDEREQRVALLATRDGLLQKVAALEAEAQLSGARGRSKRALDTGSSAATQQVELTNLKGSGELYDGFVLELLRRLVEECGVPFSAVPTANALVLAMHMRKVPPESMLVTDKTVRSAFHRLGALDKQRRFERNTAAPEATPWAPAADAGNKGREMDMLAVSRWNDELQKPVSEALACADLLNDQSGKHLAATLVRAVLAAGLHPAGCAVGPMTDGASACSGEVGEAKLFLDEMQRRAAGAVNALVHSAPRETCAIHAKALQESRGMEAAFPGHTLESFARLVWECFSRTRGFDVEFKQVWVKDCGLKAELYDECLGTLPEPTEAKWQVMYDVCVKLLPIFAVDHSQRGLAGWMIEVFLSKLLKMTRGTTDKARPLEAGKHACRSKIATIAGLVAELNLVAAMHLVIDFWEQNCLAFHKAMRSDSKFGDFKTPHLRHEMAYHTAVDSVWYAKAVDHPEAALPRYHTFIGKRHVRAFAPQMTDTKRDQLKGRAKFFLKEAEASHLKWNAQTWTRPRHLLGLLTDAKRGQWVAAHLLKILGKEGALQPAAATSTHQRSAGAAPASRVAKPSGDAVDLMLVQLFALRSAPAGELVKELALWGFDSPAMVQELVLIATTVVPADGKSVVSKARTPLLFRQLRDRLFVGFAHNLFMESCVSRLAMLEKRHPRTHALQLDNLFNYHMKLSGAREQRLSCETRSTTSRCGASAKARKNGAAKKQLHGCNRTKKQLLLLAADALANAEHFSPQQAPELIAKKANGLSRGIKESHATYTANKLAVGTVKVESMRTTCEEGPTGRARKVAPTLQTCRDLVPTQAEAGAIVAKVRGNVFKDKEGLALKRAKLAERIRDAKARSAITRRKRPMTEKAKRALEARSERQQQPQPLRNAQGAVRRPRATVAEREAQARALSRATRARQPSSSAGAGSSSQVLAQGEPPLAVPPRGTAPPSGSSNANGKRPISAVTEPEAQARALPRATRARQPSSSAGAGSSSQVLAQGEPPPAVPPRGTAPPSSSSNANGKRLIGAVAESEAQAQPPPRAARAGQPSSSAGPGSGSPVPPPPPRAEEMELMHRHAAAVALRLAKSQREAYDAAEEVAEAAMEAAQEELLAAQAKVHRAKELQASAELQRAATKAAEKEYKALRAALFDFGENYKRKNGRYPKIGKDTLEYEYRKCIERYSELKAKYPQIKKCLKGTGQR